MKKKEIWVPVKGLETIYQVSNRGRVRSLKRMIKNNHGLRQIPDRILQPSMDDRGYYHVRLAVSSGKYKLFKVHRLVAAHFLKDFSEELTVNHISGNKADNRVENLQMLSRIENLKKFHLLHKQRRYMEIVTGEVFSNFKCFCKRYNIQYSRYRFNQVVGTGLTYKETEYIFIQEK